MPRGRPGGNPNYKAKKGEPGYFERNTKDATEAAAKEHRIFQSGEEFTEAANRYFDECDARVDANGFGELYSEAGLCLGLTKYGPAHKAVTYQTLHLWYNNDERPDLQEAVQMAYLRIQHQIETDPRYQEKGGMATRAIFELKQKYLGGKQDKIEQKQETKITVTYGANMDESDFK